MKETTQIILAISLLLVFASTFACIDSPCSSNKPDSSPKVIVETTTDITPAERLGAIDTNYAFAVDRQGHGLEGISLSDPDELYYEFDYDEFGNIATARWYNPSDSLKTTGKYKYDNRGNVLEILIDSHDEFYDLQKMAFTYDQDGHQTEMIRYFKHGITWRHERNYDNEGNLTKEILWDSNGSMFHQTTYAYDMCSNKIESKLFDLEGKLEGKTTYDYDNDGRLITETLYDLEGSKGDYLTYEWLEFDSHGNWTKATAHFHCAKEIPPEWKEETLMEGMTVSTLINAGCQNYDTKIHRIITYLMNNRPSPLKQL